MPTKRVPLSGLIEQAADEYLGRDDTGLESMSCVAAWTCFHAADSYDAESTFDRLVREMGLEAYSDGPFNEFLRGPERQAVRHA